MARTFVDSNGRTVGTVVLLAVATLLIYAPALSRAPLFLHYDEVFFATQAQSIATTGHDTQGRFMPVYFEAYPGSWFQPAVVYVTALLLQLMPLSETALRLPTVFIAVFDTILMYFVAKRLFRCESWAVVAAVTLMLTPAHVIHGRLALSYLYTVPCILSWLLCLAAFVERPRLWVMFLATTSLGLGFFTYIAAVAMMPVYICMTLIVLWAESTRPWKQSAVALAGLGWLLVAALPFLLVHPSVLLQKWGTYGPRNGGLYLNPFQQLRELFNYVNLSYRVWLYFNFFNPDYLFISGGSNIVNSTRQAGVFLLPLALFIPVGIYQILQHRRDTISLVVVAGFVTSPLAAILVAESGAIDRELMVLPFGALLAAFGIAYLWSAPLGVRLRPLATLVAAAGMCVGVGYMTWTLIGQHRISGSPPYLIAASLVLYAVGRLADATRSWRPITASVLLLGLLQFAVFYRDYRTAYPIRSSTWFQDNRRGALEAIFSLDDPRHPVNVYVSTSIQYLDAYWRLYAAMFHREDLASRMIYFDPSTTLPEGLPDGALVLVLVTEGAKTDKALAMHPSLTKVKWIPELGGPSSFLVLKKTGA